jgi:hypothetical protein
MGGDVLHSQGYHITIKGLDLNCLTKSIYGLQKTFMLVARIKIKKHIVNLTYYNAKFMMKFGS